MDRVMAGEAEEEELEGYVGGRPLVVAGEVHGALDGFFVQRAQRLEQTFAVRPRLRKDLVEGPVTALRDNGVVEFVDVEGRAVGGTAGFVPLPFTNGLEPADELRVER